MRHVAAPLVLMGVVLVGVACAGPRPQAKESPAPEAQPMVVFAASAPGSTLLLPLGCSHAREVEDCLAMIPLDGSVRLEPSGLESAISGRVPVGDGSCSGPSEGLEILDPAEAWAVWPPTAAPFLRPQAPRAAGPDEQVAVTRALTHQATVLLPVSLLASIDLGVEPEPEHLLIVGSADEGTALAALRSDGIAAYLPPEGSTLRFAALVDPDGDGDYAILLTRRWAQGYAAELVEMTQGTLVPSAAWTCAW